MSRPNLFRDIIGQERVKHCLQAIIQAKSIKHILFSAKPGYGKTTLARAFANELKSEIQIANGGNIQSIKSILPYLMRVSAGSVLFIDEIHRLPPKVEEYLYPVMEDYRVDIGKEDRVSIELPHFILIGATTSVGNLTKPLYDRFHFKFTLDEYTQDELLLLIKSYKYSRLTFYGDSAIILAKWGRGTPRVLQNYLDWLVTYTLSSRDINITEERLRYILGKIGIVDGLTIEDRQYLTVLKYFKKPIGVKTLATLTGFSVETIEQTIEPYLMQSKLITKTPKGRILL